MNALNEICDKINRVRKTFDSVSLVIGLDIIVATLDVNRKIDEFFNEF